ncbi:hypothetical protein [Desulfosporosinus nitroreducens]|nr:hypothetical protein [Desulfosporosinus nitroreducens]MCO1603492.1 hypothetical protein [Desulfosporosinus nitroreducens]
MRKKLDTPSNRGFATLCIDESGWDASQTLGTLVRQAKLGTSYKVKVLAG